MQDENKKMGITSKDDTHKILYLLVLNGAGNGTRTRDIKLGK
jgi:hypothetical protein